MAEPDFRIKQGDTLPVLRATLQNGSLTGAVEVRFQMRVRTRRGMAKPKAITGVAVIEDVATQTVRYNWLSTDTAVAGLYEAEWQVTYTDGTVLTYPNNSYNLIEVLPQVA